MGERKYNSYTPYNRTKLPRNKWGLQNMATISTGSSLFGSTDSSNAVGNSLSTIEDFRGCTEFENGVRGLVPAPLMGESEFFLSATGSWVEIPELKWMREFPVGKGFEKTGIQIDGDLNVTDTLSVMNLEVQGAAHFWSLIVDEVKSTGGQLIVSPSNFYVDHIGDIQYHAISDPTKQYTTLLQSRIDIYDALIMNDITYFKCRRLYQRNDDSNKRTVNECVVGDMLRCRQFNIEKDGKYSDVKNDDWWSFVAGVGTETYTDESNHTYDAFYIDIVYALEKSDGSTVPLGSVLKTKEEGIEYPSYWTSDIVADELKRISQNTLDGTTDIEPEMYDPEEWKDIKNHVIKIRGVDDSINTLVGTDSEGEIDDSNIDQAGSILSTIANGTTTPAVSDDYTESDYSSLILNGTLSNNNNPGPYSVQNALSLAEGTLSDNVEIPNTKNMIQEKSNFSSFYLEDSTITETTLYAAEDMTVIIDGVESELEKGDEIPVGAEIKDGAFVSEGIDTVIYKKYNPSDDPSTAVQITGTELDIVQNGTKDTSFGTDRDVNRLNNLNYDQRMEWKFGYGEFTIKEGSSLACLGHLFDPDRQNAIVISATNPIDPDLVAPAIAQYNYIDTFGESISKYRFTSIASNGNEFIGSFLVNYNDSYLDINDRINIFVNDMKTGLESVGIHLDGEKSTITLKGNIDIRQHSSDSWDSLNLYDNRDIKRLEISPFDIPSRTSSSFANITRKKFYLPNTYTTTTIPSNYVSQNKWKDWSAPGLFYYYWVYSFEMKNYTLSYSTTVTLGSLDAGYELDLQNIDFNLWYTAYVCDDTYVSTYKTSGIKIYYTLKRNGVNVSGHSDVDITSLFTQTPTSGESNDIYLKSTGTIIDDYNIQSSGNYTITFKILFNTYMYTRKFNDGYNNPYISTYVYLYGNGEMVYAPGQSASDTDTSLRKMNIGTNGFSFVGNNSRYFYAATDGVEMKWDNVSIGLDPSVGIKINNRVYTTSYITSHGGVVPVDADIVITSNPSSAQTISLYNGSADLGAGKSVTLIDCANVTVNNCAHPKTMYCQWEEPWGEDERTWTVPVTTSVRKFIWYNSQWYEV